ncbi:hypothetical protein H8K38_13770 [Undibacterium sp. FT79W]|jgi:hypothetical protein|uniref:hypothetical protein n=1 Tax=Undibacterium sp. FT79W TaxID=2762296 RepID=UPI00164A7382|nr:hypothetical protein [Undibacterium sp. FT79W]MBC3878876.1 hypothetical protein [Undibacterium sp. FT79W]
MTQRKAGRYRLMCQHLSYEVIELTEALANFISSEKEEKSVCVHSPERKKANRMIGLSP